MKRNILSATICDVSDPKHRRRIKLVCKKTQDGYQWFNDAEGIDLGIRIAQTIPDAKLYLQLAYYDKHWNLNVNWIQ